MSWLALKVDVDTLRGTDEGAPRLAALFERLGVSATFLFSLGPDHTGRAIRRVFRRGFAAKVRRTSVVSNYGWKTLLYGTLLPGPDIGRRCGAVMQDIARRGFETGVHAYDHVRWQDGVASADLAWTRTEMQRAVDAYLSIFGHRPSIHGAAGWQLNAHVPELQSQLGFRIASDVRGETPFIPVRNGSSVGPPQLPTTLPTLDELIGRPDLGSTSPVDHLLSLTATQPQRGHVYTLHAEIEGGAHLAALEQLIRGWQQQGYRIGSLSQYHDSLTAQDFAHCEISAGAVEGRSGSLACQGRAIEQG